MKQLFKLPALLAWGCWLFFSSNSKAQVCDNQALAFDGNGDYISLTTTATLVTGDANFTAEAWFYANPTGNLSRLMSLTGNAAFSTIEVGLLGSGALFIYWRNTPGNGGTPLPVFIPTTPADLTGACHHLALIRNGGTLQVYLNGSLVYTNSSNVGPFSFDEFLVGHSNSFTNQDWNGQVDEIRLWSSIRSGQQIKDYKDCSLSGTSTGLMVNWTLDQGLMPGGPNLANTQALDVSGNFNHGNLIGFNLDNLNPPTPINGNLVSNFVCYDNTCPPRYLLNISDQISLFPSSLFSICAGEKAHFCVTDINNNAVSVPAGSTVTWESSENNAAFAPDPDLTAYPYAANALCFGVNKGIITNSSCNSIGPGYADRKYRAKVQKISGLPGQQEICTFYTEEEQLRICCPPTSGTISIVPNIPAPWCEGDFVTMTVFLNPADPWLPFAPNATIDWCLVEGGNITPLPQYQNLLAFNNLQIPIGVDDICLQAKIYHCSCPPITVELCIPVDPDPVCGTIDVVANPPKPINPTPPAGFPYQYKICPGDYSELEMAAPFTNCDPVWQYHFGPPAPLPTSPGWTDLGTSNSNQNTNTLPQLNPIDPAFWPSGVTCIYYRIECRPESYPNSGCDPCYSNMVEICLEPSPPSGTISGPTQFCEGGPYPTLAVTPDVAGNWEYCWSWNGILEFVGPSNTYTINKPGCYWVGIKNGCETTMVGPYCVEECVLKPIIKCPTDNPCACDGLPITLDGCDSEDSCNAGPMTYSWLALPSGNTGTGCTFTDIPDPNGTTYTLTITNTLGCSKTSKPLTIKPCN
ncbi:MAG: LamG domain-containing protein [Saprospiraceae bacterium]|jgi:hypothetical protein|nr:LamG domain-containing protein [Saprospiraceae bacterium]